MAEMVKGKLPENVAAPDDAPQGRVPKAGAACFKVRTRGVPRFTRAGITFGPDPTYVDATSLTDEQKVGLLNCPTLDVEELAGPPADEPAPHHRPPPVERGDEPAPAHRSSKR